MNRLTFVAIMLLGCSQLAAQPNPTRDDVTRALASATRFMHTTIAAHGGYAYFASPDGRLSHGEGPAGRDRIWVQPPGTPSVGEAFLDAYLATGDDVHLNAARDGAHALVAGQLASGGWHYSVEFTPELRRPIPYRIDLVNQPDRLRKLASEGGWHVWRLRQQKTNITILDDDTTPATLRFLIRFDRATKSSDKQVQDSIRYALTSILNAQYPIGGWPHNYDHFPTSRPDASRYPILQASIPSDWPRKFPGDFRGCYYLNDRVSLDMIKTCLAAYDAYNEPRHLAAAIEGGEFLLRAQLPMPQPAWAQQYSAEMHPVWDRKFEPPAITGFESQDVLLTLLDLYDVTGEERFLEPIPKAIAYLRASQLPDGNLARFYELATNRPLYFSKDYQLTYDAKESPDHYGFVQPSRLDDIEAQYKLALASPPSKRVGGRSPQTSGATPEQVRAILGAQSPGGAWLEPGFVRDATGKKVVPDQGVISSATFATHARSLSRFIQSQNNPN